MALGLSTGMMAQKKEMNTNQKMDPISWDDAKEAYHEVMASTFHPAEEGDFKPLREDYKDLAIKAKEWNSLPVPSNLSEKELKPLLEKLYMESTKIGELVEAKASDETLKKAIFDLHDVFHGIVGLCNEH
jgi:hypothetical protein